MAHARAGRKPAGFPVTAGKELATALEASGLDKSRIAVLLSPYSVSRLEPDTDGGLAGQVSAFLAAKRVDGLSEKTLRGYRCILNAFASATGLPAEEATPDILRGYLSRLSGERGLKPVSICTHMNTLRSFFSWLTAEGTIQKNPMGRIKSPRLDRLGSRHPLTRESLERLRDCCRTPFEKALLEFLVSSGCRVGEIVGLPVPALDFLKRSVTVTGKGNKRRMVYFSERAKVALEGYLSSRKGGEALFCGSRRPYPALGTRSIQKALGRLGERCPSLPRIHPHLLRHTFATLALQAGMDITVVQQLLGHTDTKTTLIYAELSQGAIRFEYDKAMG